jgi:hypothetical protein
VRKFGLVVMCASALAFFYASGRVSKAPPMPEGLEVSETIRYEQGKWELARYAAAAGGVIGLLFLFFPEGR